MLLIFFLASYPDEHKFSCYIHDDTFDPPKRIQEVVDSVSSYPPGISIKDLLFRVIQEISSPDSPEKTEVHSVHDPSGESGPDGLKSNEGLEEEEDGDQYEGHFDIDLDLSNLTLHPRKLIVDKKVLGG